MSPKGFLALAAAAVASVALAAGAIVARDVPASGSRLDQPLFPDLVDRLDEVQRVRAVVEGRTMTLERRDGAWSLVEKDGYPADPQKVREVALGLASARLVEAKTRREDRLSRLELEDPQGEGAKSRLVRLEDAEGRALAAAVIGKTKFGVYGPGRSGTYVRRADETQAYLSDMDIDVPAEPLDWLRRDIVDVAGEALQRVVLQAGGDAPVVLSRSSPEAETLTLASVPEGREVDEEKIERVMDVVSRLTFQDVEPADQLAPAADAVEAVYETRDGLRLTFRVLPREAVGEGGATQTEYWATVSPEALPASDRPSAAGAPASGEEAEQGTPEPLAERVAELERRLDGWAFKLPGYLGERLTWTRENLLKPADGTS